MGVKKGSTPRDDVLQGELDDALFAASFEKLVRNDGPLIDRDLDQRGRLAASDADGSFIRQCLHSTPRTNARDEHMGNDAMMIVPAIIWVWKAV